MWSLGCVVYELLALSQTVFWCHKFLGVASGDLMRVASCVCLALDSLSLQQQSLEEACRVERAFALPSSSLQL